MYSPKADVHYAWAVMYLHLSFNCVASVGIVASCFALLGASVVCLFSRRIHSEHSPSNPTHAFSIKYSVYISSTSNARAEHPR